jgi:acetyl esterase/lipase
MKSFHLHAFVCWLFLTASVFSQSYYLAPSTTFVRGVISVEPVALTDPTWQAFAARTSTLLLVGPEPQNSLATLATTTGKPEVSVAPYVPYGISSGGVSALRNAMLNPTRCIAVIPQHPGRLFFPGNDAFNFSHLDGSVAATTLFDFSGAFPVPAIFLCAERDNLSGIVMPTENFEIGRRMGNAPWCMITQPNVQHTGTPIPPALVTTILEGMITRRLPVANWPATQAPVLQTLDVTTGWLGDLVTKTTAPYATFTGDRTRAAWLPDAASASAWAAYVVAQPFRRPTQTIVLPTAVANLQVFDTANATIFPSDQAGGVGGEAAWKVCGDLKVADLCYLNAHGSALYTVPASVVGAEWIRPLDARTYTGTTLLSFTLTKDADIYIAHDNAMATKPSWLTGWTNTGENITLGNGTTLFSAPYTLRLYKKSFLSGQSVALGPNGGSQQHLMYFTIIKAAANATANEVSLIVSDGNAAEAGLDTAVFSATRSATSTGAITVNYTVTGTATSGSDFAPLTGSVLIPDGQSSASITITPINDTLIEGAETVTLTLQSGAGYTLGTVASGSITIADDDGAAKPEVGISFAPTTATEGTTPSTGVTLTRTGATTSALGVSLSLTGDAGIDADYTGFPLNPSIPVGAASMSFMVTLLDDTLIEAVETMTLTVISTTAYNAATNSTASLTITDNDATGLPIVTITASDADAGEPSNGGVFTLTRTGSTAAPLTVTFAMSGTAARANDYTLQNTSSSFTYLFPAGSASIVRTLTVIDDTLAESTETAICSLVANAAYTIGSPSSATVTLTDNDSTSGLPTVTLAATNANAAEPGTSGTFTISRTGATTAALTVNFAVSGTATSGSDYTALATSVSIPAGQSTAILTVTPIDDTISESTETVIVTLSSNAAYSLGSPSTATLNLADNDNTDPWIQQPVITYATRGTKDLKLDIYLPKTPLPGLLPVLIYIPGGGWSSVTRGSIGTNFKNFTADGFAVVSIDHTNSPDAKWPAQIQDCKAAVRWLRANAATYNFDTTRFAVTGISSGGHLAAMIGTTGGVSSSTIGATTVDFVGANPLNPTQSDAVQAVMPIMPPTHLLWADHYFTSSIPDKNDISSPQSQLVGFPVQTVPELVATAIPMTFISPTTPPFFITQGTSDTFVTFNASELLNEALFRANRSATFWTTVNGGHDASTTATVENTLLMQQFLKRTLLGSTANALPVASFTSSVSSGPAPLTVSFNGSASSDSDGSVTKYAWSFGENAGANNATAAYTYTTPGIYPVTLAVRDNLGGCASTTQFITVLASTPATGTAPGVAITAPTDGLVLTRPANQLAQATVSDSDGTIVTVEFILDGQTTGFDRAAPFLCIWGNLAVGAHTVAVRGYDSSGNTTLTPTPVTFYVQDPALPPTITLTATNPNASEPGTGGTFTVTRTGGTGPALTVNYALSGTATNGTDYTALTGSVTIPSGQASVAIPVSPIDDALVEGSETVIVTLIAHAAYTLGSPSMATVNIADNDSSAGLPTVTVSSTDTLAAEAAANTGSVTFTRTGSTTSALTLNLGFSGSAGNGADVTTVPSTLSIAAGQSAATLTITPVDDTLVEGTEIFTVRLAACRTSKDRNRMDFFENGKARREGPDPLGRGRWRF